MVRPGIADRPGPSSTRYGATPRLRVALVCFGVIGLWPPAPLLAQEVRVEDTRSSASPATVAALAASAGLLCGLGGGAAIAGDGDGALPRFFLGAAVSATVCIAGIGSLASPEARFHREVWKYVGVLGAALAAEALSGGAGVFYFAAPVVQVGIAAGWLW